VSGSHKGPATNFSFSLKFSSDSCGFFYFVEPSLTRGRVCNLLLLLVLASAVPRDSRPYFIVLILQTPPTWRAKSLYLYPPRNRVAQLYPRALGSLSVASYDSQGYGGGILSRLHMGFPFMKSVTQYIYRTMCVCVLFIGFQKAAASVTVADLPGVVLDTSRRRWLRVQANLFPEARLLCEKGNIRIVTRVRGSTILHSAASGARGRGGYPNCLPFTCALCPTTEQIC
jgi:hypothetical protein